MLTSYVIEQIVIPFVVAVIGGVTVNLVTNDILKKSLHLTPASR